MKKIIQIFLLIMIFVFVVACGNESDETADVENDAEESEEVEQTSEDEVKNGGSEYSGESHEWKIGWNNPEESTRGVTAKTFKEVVEEKTEGKVTIELFPSEILGSEQEMIEQVGSGALEMQVSGGSALQNIVPEYATLGLPFMVETFDEAYAVLDGEIGDELRDMAYEHGLKVLTHTDTGMVQISNSKKAIHSAVDLEGLKIRIRRNLLPF